VVGAIVVGALALSSTAKAGLLPGLLSTAKASYCDPSSSQVFHPWGDTANYAELFNGGFENGSGGWALSGGARVVSGNETFHVGGKGDDSSLYLPAGASAMSGTVCFKFGDWHMRFFARSTTSRSTSIHVQVVVPSLLGGLLSILDGGTVNADGSWDPSPRLQILLGNVTSLLGTNAVAFRFTNVGSSAAQLDDIYLDPWKCT
jgi:hypothetical protein